MVKDICTSANGNVDFVDHKANIISFEGTVASPKAYVGAGRAFLSWLMQNFKYSDAKTNNVMYERLAKIHLRHVIEASGHTYVYMNFNVGDESAGKLLIECYDDVCPKTVKNFVDLVKGESDSGGYENSPIHRIVPKGWLQGGDIVSGKGNTGDSIYGETFNDETFNVKHDKMGIVGMVNKGPHTNASQFYITLGPLPWMDGKAVGIGYVIEGMRMLRVLEKAELENERPVVPIVIKDCGVYVV